MTKYFTNNYTLVNLYKKPSVKSEIVTQMIYGESFSILKRSLKWLKIKILEDNYKGFVKRKNFSNFLKPSHKVKVLRAKVYKFAKKGKKINEISFGSKIKVERKKLKFLKFSKDLISKNDVNHVSFKESYFFRNINIFKNVKYKWGGKSFKG